MDRVISDSQRKKKKRLRMIRISLGLIVGVVALVTLGSIMRASVPVSDLNVATADVGMIDITVTGSGTVSPAFEEVITSPIDSRIVEVYHKAGDSVGVDTPLLRLDLQSTESEVKKLNNMIAMKRHELEQQRVNSGTRIGDLKMQIKVKEMALSILEGELHNEMYLDSIGSGTGDRIRQAELAVKTGMLELQQLKEQLANEERVAKAGDDMKHLDIDIARNDLSEISRTLDDARIKSPREATITFIHDRIGEKVTEGQKIAVISDLNHFRVNAEISDAYASRVAVGSKATVRIGKERIAGTVSNLTPQSHNGVISFTVRLDEDAHPRLRSGLNTDVYIHCDVVDDAVRIPNGSYYTGPGTYSLFFITADNKELKKREVKLGESSYEFVEVVSGIRSGDRVVISDMSDFKDSKTLRLR